MNIKTEFDSYWEMGSHEVRIIWTAIDDNTYDGPGSPIGTGQTEQDAINDLLEQIEVQ